MITADYVLFEIEKLTYMEVVNSYGEKTAVSCANSLLNCLYLNFKGRLIYIPSTSSFDKKDMSEIYTKICQEFTGRNQQELAIKFGRSTQNIYAIIKRERENEIRKVQFDLFPELLPVLDKRPVTIMVLEDYLPNEFFHCGLETEESKKLSKKISMYLRSNFPGVSIYISEEIKNKRTISTQTSLF